MSVLKEICYFSVSKLKILCHYRKNSIRLLTVHDILLKLYALFKQSTVGDVQGETPNAMDFKAMAKYRSWESLKGKSMDDCKKEYIHLVNSLE